MKNKYLDKLKSHKLAFFGLSLFCALLGSVVLLRFNIDKLENDILFYVCWMGMLLLLLLIAISFDRQAQPYLHIYHKSITIIPWTFFVGFILSIFLSQLQFNKIVCLTIYLLSVAIAVFLFLLISKKNKNLTEDKVEETMSKNLINLSTNEQESLSKYKKFYKWNFFLVLAVLIIIGQYIVQYKLIFSVLALCTYLFCFFSCFMIYKIKYKSKRNRIFHLLLDSAIFLGFAICAILLNYQVFQLPMKSSISSLEIVFLVCFGLAPYAKQNAYAYFSVEHRKIREEFKADIE